jgi:hypothetical protein
VVVCSGFVSEQPKSVRASSAKAVFRWSDVIVDLRFCFVDCPCRHSYCSHISDRFTTASGPKDLRRPDH